MIFGSLIEAAISLFSGLLGGLFSPLGLLAPLLGGFNLLSLFGL